MKCKTCGGEGEYQQMAYAGGYSPEDHVVTCSGCDGTGEVDDDDDEDEEDRS